MTARKCLHLCCLFGWPGLHGRSRPHPLLIYSLPFSVPCVGPSRLTSVGCRTVCASAVTLFSGFQLGPVAGGQRPQGVCRSLLNALAARLPLFQRRLSTFGCHCSIPMPAGLTCPGFFPSPWWFLQPYPHLCEQSLHYTLFSVKQSKHLLPAGNLVTCCQQPEATSWDHLPGLCGPDRPADTASASHRCWSREAPGQACTWGSNLPGGSGQSFSHSCC